jgi:predicted nucleotidyltransferase
MTYKLPTYVKEVISELKNENITKSIWLIGSRANNNAKEDSDWDILVFSKKRLSQVKRRHNNIDVILVGVDGDFLVEGMGISFKRKRQ